MAYPFLKRHPKASPFRIAHLVAHGQVKTIVVSHALTCLVTGSGPEWHLPISKVSSSTFCFSVPAPVHHASAVRASIEALMSTSVKNQRESEYTYFCSGRMLKSHSLFHTLTENTILRVELHPVDTFGCTIIKEFAVCKMPYCD
jgi:hypothetical protein